MVRHHIRSSNPRPQQVAAAAREQAPRKMGISRNHAAYRRKRPAIAARRRPVTESRTHNTETYDRIHENRFLAARQNPLSTFSIDVDTASYANLRRFLKRGKLPPKGAVRLEEMVNYFSYDYDPPTNTKRPFSVHVDMAQAPWQKKHRLVRIGLKGKIVNPKKRPASNLVFLIDVSGSMRYGAKLPLLKKAFKLLVSRLDKRDRVAIVVYAGAAGLVLPPTRGDQKSTILGALSRLRAGGSTNGGAGIRLAYRLARSNFVKGGINRVILATDGDFNVGTTSRSALVRLVEKKAKHGVYLTVLGFGMGNYKDDSMEQISNKGNGNYAYIDSMAEARKVLVDGMAGTLMAIAKDVKIQVEFNPNKVRAYRLLGYENRMLNKEDFNDDKKDAGDIGAGHTVTALYEVVPKGVKNTVTLATVDPLRYGHKSKDNTASTASGTTAGKVSRAARTTNNELLYVKLRYKKPDGDSSRLLTYPISDRTRKFAKASVDFQFAAAVAAFGMLLRESKHKGTATYRNVLSWAGRSRQKKHDRRGYRKEFFTLVRTAAHLTKPVARVAQ
jgi:Ca-activated chloride channel family protein